MSSDPDAVLAGPHRLAGAARPVPAPAEERRQVTVLFADLVGFTALAERLDPEEVRDITTDCLRQLAAEAVRFEGTIDKLIGDAVMILFGAPVAHEDDPARALRTALAMQRTLARFNQDLERTRGLALRLRIGIESGEVVAGPREVGGVTEYTVIGDAVNVAARLQTAAEPGTILVGEATCQRAGARFRFRPTEPLLLRGRERPVAAAVLLGEAAEPAAPAPRLPLVGRDAELGAIRDRLDALRAGQGGAVLVVGPPGIGKSRLLAEPRAHAEGLTWVRCQAYAHEQAESYGLARTLVRALLGIGPEDGDERAAHRLHDELAALGRLDVEAALGRLLGTGSSADQATVLDALPPSLVQRRLFEAAIGLVDGLAARQPLVLELDDLQWADPTSLDLLLELLGRAGQLPLLLCCAFRPEPDDACQVLRERGPSVLRDRLVTLNLAPLSDAASAALVAQILGRLGGAAQDDEAVVASELPATLRPLLERAAGTPLWLEELARTLVERGLLSEDERGWQLDEQMSTVELPDSLQALIVARIDRLGPARPTIQVASVIGRRFGHTVLERVAESPARLDDDLDQAQRADLVRELPASGDREYHFKHVLVRDAAYATLLHRRRRDLHRRVAEAVEALYPERVRELHSLLAFHYERAEDWVRASAHARAAAEAARSGYANREALASYGLALRAAERAGLGPAERAALYEGRAAVHEHLGDFEAARRDYEAALAGACGDAAAQVRLLGALGMLWGGHKDYQRGAELTSAAVALAGQTGEARAQADASLQLGIMQLNLLRLGEARPSLEAALRLYEALEDERGQARVRDALGLLALCDGRFADATRLLTDAYDRLTALGDGIGAASCAAMLGVPLALGGWRADAERWVRRALSICQEVGAPSGEAFAWMILAEGLDPYGAYRHALAAAERCQALARPIGHREWSLAALGPIGRVRRARGDLAGALELHREMLAIAREVGSRLWTVEALANVARDALRLGDRAAARTYADEACALGGRYQKGTLDAWLTRIELRLADGRPAEALAEARRTRALIAELRVRLPEVWCLEGDALDALADRTGAEQAYRAALAAARSVGAAVGLWQAGQRLGRVLARTGRADEADTVLAQTDAETDRLGQELGEPTLRQTLSGHP